MKIRLIAITIVLASASLVVAGEPDYTAWTNLLQSYFDPDRGMDYRGLQTRETRTLAALRNALSQVDIVNLSPSERLAYWINLYNLTTVSLIVERYPVASIRDLSTDPLIRLNIFKRTKAATRLGALSLQTMEDVHIREAFRDPRIHFAINCAARSCPPMRREAFVGSRLDAQLDDQTRVFLSSSMGAVFELKGQVLKVRLSKILDWFRKDFEAWSGGIPAFLQRYLSQSQAQQVSHAGTALKLEFDSYDWSLNDWRR